MKKKNKKNKTYMSKDKKEKDFQSVEQNADETKETTDVETQEDTSTTETEEKEITPQQQIAALTEQLEKEKKEYLFLLAEFDNFRKRTIKEKAEIIKNGTENAMRDILPIVDDFDRALDAMGQDTTDLKGLKEGVELIYDKFMKYLQKNGVVKMDTDEKEFDADLHEAITVFPTDDESKKGKVIDTVQKGYTINDKVLRHAKVVVGQ